MAVHQPKSRKYQENENWRQRRLCITEKETKFKVIEFSEDEIKPDLLNIRCPKCGGREIEACFQPKWFFEIDEYKKDKIRILCQEDLLQLVCSECGEFEDSDEIKVNLEEVDISKGKVRLSGPNILF